MIKAVVGLSERDLLEAANALRSGRLLPPYSTVALRRASCAEMQVLEQKYCAGARFDGGEDCPMAQPLPAFRLVPLHAFHQGFPPRLRRGLACRFPSVIWSISRRRSLKYRHLDPT
jgi:hypothetical protein